MCGVRASHCSGFSWCRPWTLGRTGFRSCSLWAQELQLPGSRTEAQQLCHGLSCPVARGALPWQGPHLCLLHQQVHSPPLSHQGSPDCLPLKLLTFAPVSLSLLVCSVCPQPVRVKHSLAGTKTILSTFSLRKKQRHISVFFKCFALRRTICFKEL